MIIHRLDKQGDTLVEVLIAMAIISLVLVGAYVTSVRNATALQSSQEREQAQRLVQSQIEALRAQGGIATSGDCFVGTTESSGVACNLTTTNSGATYTMSITGPTGTTNPVGVYTVMAVWTGIGSKTANDSSVTMYYRLN